MKLKLYEATYSEEYRVLLFAQTASSTTESISNNGFESPHITIIFRKNRVFTMQVCIQGTFQGSHKYNDNTQTALQNRKTLKVSVIRYNKQSFPELSMTN